MRLALVATVIVAAASVAHADASGVRFEATVSSENITLDQQVELTVTLDRSGSQPFESYRAPTAPDFDLVHTGSSEQTQFSMMNGRTSVRVIEQHDYVYKPRKKGALKIGPASVRIAGTDLKTREIVVHVGAPLKNGMSSVGQQAQPGINVPMPPPEAMGGAEDLFVDASVDKPKVYVGQQVTASWHLYTDSQILKYRPLAEPKYEDFWSEDLFVPTSHLGWDRAVAKGHEYEVALLLKKALFPLKAGKLTITPLEAEATTLSTAFMAGASDMRKSKALTVDVMPLPVEGRPAGFEPVNVGHYELSSSVDRAAVKAGEAVTWKVTVRGVGNIRNVKLPKLDKLDGFRVYEPTTKETIDPGDEIHGQKVYTYLLLPQKGGKLEVPPVELAYFDPEAGKYAVARSQPIELTVEGDPTQVEAQSPTSTTENVLGQQIRPIRNRASVRSSVGDRLFRGRIAIIMLAVPPGAWILVLIGDALRRRLARETAGSKRRRARRNARRRLRVAEYHIKAQRPSAFFGECARVIYEHLEYRLGNKVEAFTLGELREYLIAREFDRETVENVVKELENCDFARFAPSASGPGEMRAAMRRVRALLPFIERQKPIELDPTHKSARTVSGPIVLGSILLALCCGTSARAADTRAPETEIAVSKDATFRRGNDAYFHGRYQEAVEAYEQVAALGVVSGDLFYNLGNAYLKTNQLGPSIYNYERALELDPSQDDVRFNLNVAREAARKKGEDRLAGVEKEPFWMRVADQVTVNWSSWLFLALYVTLFALLIALHFVQPGFLRVGMWAGFAFVGIATALAGALLGARLYLADRVEQAIILPDVVQVKEGPDPNYQSVFGVHAGLRVRVTEKEQDWVRIRLANGLEGWVRERDLGRL